MTDDPTPQIDHIVERVAHQLGRDSAGELCFVGPLDFLESQLKAIEDPVERHATVERLTQFGVFLLRERAAPTASDQLLRELDRIARELGAGAR